MKRTLEQVQQVSQLASQLSSQLEDFARLLPGANTTAPPAPPSARGAVPVTPGTPRAPGTPETPDTPPQMNVRPSGARGNPLVPGPGGAQHPGTPQPAAAGDAIEALGNRLEQVIHVFGRMGLLLLDLHTWPTLHPAPLPPSPMQSGHDGDSRDDVDGDCPERFGEEDLKRRTELKIEEDDTAEEMQTLRSELPSNTTITRVTIDGSHPAGVRATLAALQYNVTVKALCVVAWRGTFDPQLLERLTALLKKQTPLECLELSLVDNVEFNRAFTFDQDFFEALFAHPHLQTIRIDCEQIDRIYLRQPQQLAAVVRDNTRLTHLELRGFKDCATLWQAIAPGLQANRSISTLDLRQNDLSGFAPAIASLLQANPTLTTLDIEATEWKAGELEIVIDAVAGSSTLRALHFYRASECGAGIDPEATGPRPALGQAIGKLLATNPHLESLGIQSQLDEPNVAAIREGFNANSGLRCFDPGEIRGAGNAEGAADATDAINQLLAANSRLTSVMLRAPRANDADATCGLKGLERNTSVRSLKLHLADAPAGVISLLQINRQISSLTLASDWRLHGPAKLVAQLEAIFDAVTDNTTLQAFRLEYDLSNEDWKDDIDLILARFDALCGRNKRLQEQRDQQLQRASAPATGIGLLNEFRRNDDASWPALRSEEAMAIAGAIDTVLPQEEAQRVLDVLRFADIRHA